MKQIIFFQYYALSAELREISAHKKYSGSWPLALYFREHLDQLKLFCAKAHERWTNTTEVVTLEAYVNHWPITFDDRRLKPIWADMIMYAEERERPPPEILSYYYVIKGNRPDCVFYMDRVKRFREEGFEILFGEHVCGITGFEELVSNKSKT